MRYPGLMFALLATGLLAGPARGQQPPDTSVAYVAERDAGNADLIKAEKLVNGGAKRGPDGEACSLMTSALLHYVKAAVASGARTRAIAWSELTSDEQAEVKKTPGPWQRNVALRQHICTKAP